jgi:diguanylate cyclase (GGDEF)-like protein
VDLGKEAERLSGRWFGKIGPSGRRGPARPSSKSRRVSAILRFVRPFSVLVVGAVVVCSVLGFVLARQADDNLEAQHRHALRSAVDALQAISPDLINIDPRLILVLERASGLKDLKFESELSDGAREVQSLVDQNGRIVGWFSWEAERPATALLMQLLPFAAAMALSVLGFAGLAMWQLSRVGRQLAKSEQQLQRLEREDATTGLPNETEMLDRLGHSLAARKPDETLALAILDLDGFSEVKDAIGSSGGEKVVLEIANRLRGALPPSMELARLRRDRLAMLMPSLDPEMALALAEAARDAVSQAIWVDQAVQVSASIGLAVAPHDGTDREALMRHAKLALRNAKGRGRGLVMPFAPEMEADFDERRFIRLELSAALAARTFELYYQPIVKADGGAIVGVEALLRWNHPTRGFIPPAVFVRVAEEAGLMGQLGEFVLRRALADAARWPDLYVAVNLSPVQVRDRRFTNTVAAILKENSVPPSRVVLEITEGLLIDEPETAKSRLEELRKLGVRLALDDFGAGYSSLTYLQRLPFDKLKIDRGFVAALEHSANTGVIIQAIVSLGRALGMSVLIEGVETEEQRVLLRLAGCNEMQGFLFARPGPREEIDRLLAVEDTASTARPLRA